MSAHAGEAPGNRNGLTFLTYIVRMSEAGVPAQQRTSPKREFHQTVEPMYIFQGLTADMVRLPGPSDFSTPGLTRW